MTTSNILIPTPSQGPINQGATFQARLAHKDASGSSIADEGNAIQQADVASIACNVYNLDSSTPTTAVATPTVTVGTSILDTLTDDEVWTVDSIGRNFVHSVAGSVFATANLFRIVYAATLSSDLNSEIITWAYQHQVVSLSPTPLYRASQDDVRNLIDSDPTIDVLPFIRLANVLVGKIVDCAADKDITLSTAQLRELEGLLAAHFYSFRDQQYISKRTERAQAAFMGKTGMGLDYSPWGQAAKMLDNSGCLADFESGVTAEMFWLGLPPSEQTDYKDRD